MKRAVLCALLILVGTISAGQTPPPDISHGNGLLEACTTGNDNTPGQMICFGYIQGVYDTLAISGQKKGIYCVPSEVTMGRRWKSL